PHTLEGALWSSVPLADFGTPTFVLRDGETAYVAQFRHRNSDSTAHITFIAPDVNLCGDSGWLSLIDTMTQAAGRRGATLLKAEVCETGSAFAVLRQAGFSVYARQEIWQRTPGPLAANIPNLLRSETDHDAWAINSLFGSVVPRLVLQANAVPEIG